MYERIGKLITEDKELIEEVEKALSDDEELYASADYTDNYAILKKVKKND